MAEKRKRICVQFDVKDAEMCDGCGAGEGDCSVQRLHRAVLQVFSL
mgnify:CR=1 FL=1